MDRFQCMSVFVDVADRGLAGAADAFNLTLEEVSEIVAALERNANRKLVANEGGQLELTEAGKRYLQRCKRILHDLAELDGPLLDKLDQPERLSISAPSELGVGYFMPVASSFLKANPNVLMRCLFVERDINLANDGIDIWMTVGPTRDLSSSAVKVGSAGMIVCASPSYLGAAGTPSKPLDVHHHVVIGIGAQDGTMEWTFGRANASVSVRPRLFCNTPDAAVAAAAEGCGLVRVRSFEAAEAIREGKLRPVLSDYQDAPQPINLVFAKGTLRSTVSEFITFAAGRLKQNQSLQA